MRTASVSRTRASRARTSGRSLSSGECDHTGTPGHGPRPRSSAVVGTAEGAQELPGVWRDVDCVSCSGWRRRTSARAAFQWKGFQGVLERRDSWAGPCQRGMKGTCVCSESSGLMCLVITTPSPPQCCRSTCSGPRGIIALLSSHKVHLLSQLCTDLRNSK